MHCTPAEQTLSMSVSLELKVTLNTQNFLSTQGDPSMEISGHRCKKNFKM